MRDLESRDVMGRIWRGDHTVWKPEPAEITNRLGWLTVSEDMRVHVDDLQALANEVRTEGYRHVVLLGMGGSSLGPEVLRRVLGSAEGYPELIVLDSTVPDWVQAVTDAIDPGKTLFLVSSKSGGTIEPMSFYKHFRSLVDESVGAELAGKNFVAITDPGTSLATMAKELGFRRVFENPPDIGGRYSVLSYFGLVPAALMGVDLTRLLNAAECVRQGSRAEVPTSENPGARLGAVMGSLAVEGRDKLTVVTSPALESFGLWAEQLIAESTGKEGKGIVPIAGEPLLAPGAYRDDRLFVYLRLETDKNAATDVAVEALSAAGHPTVQIDLKDAYDIGSEFFRWELATTVAGAIIGIQPFDQPNVQTAKDETNRVLAEQAESGKLPSAAVPDSVSDLLANAKPGDYLAIMAYIKATPEVDAALDDLRRAVAQKFHIATTVGYGPRFLHSTGQLHKGGPQSGLFLQITSAHEGDIEIPGEQFGFSMLADAQALGDVQVLAQTGRPTARVRLDGGNHAAGIKALFD